VLAGLDLIPLTADLVESASSIGPPDLRSLDAIHLSSALLISEDVTAFVAYDVRLKTAALAAGLEVVAPT
jgi:predicted nucleic acid-binding protein